MAGQKGNYLLRIILYIALSVFTMIFYTFWRTNLIAGLVFSLIFFYLIIDLFHQKTLFREFSQFRGRDLWYLLPVLLEWLVALPIYIQVLGITDWNNLILISDGKALLKEIIFKLLLVIREEVATSFCWLMITFLVMRLLKVKDLQETQLKFTIVVLSILFALGHYSNAAIIASHPALDMSTKFLGAASVFINAFILGMYLKTTYIRIKSLQTCVIIHFLLNLRRGFFSILSQQFELITMQQIGYEALILVIYIIAITLLWRKEWNLKKLNEIYAALA